MTFWLVALLFLDGEVHTFATPHKTMALCAQALQVAAAHYPTNAAFTCIAYLRDRRTPT